MSSASVDLRAVPGTVVHARDHPGDLANVVVHRVPGADHRGEAALLGHAPHHDEMLAEFPVGAVDVGDPLVDVGCQPPV